MPLGSRVQSGFKPGHDSVPVTTVTGPKVIGPAADAVGVGAIVGVAIGTEELPAGLADAGAGVGLAPAAHPPSRAMTARPKRSLPAVSLAFIPPLLLGRLSRVGRRPGRCPAP